MISSLCLFSSSLLHLSNICAASRISDGDHGLWLLNLTMPTLDPRLYSVIWFAPLEIEAQAAVGVLDHLHDGHFALGPGDDHVFRAGDIAGYNVVIASFPAGQEYGTSTAAALAGQVKAFFPNLQFGLLVGVAAGLPDWSQNPPRDIRLGDVLVALSCDDRPAVIPYGLGKETRGDDFQLLRSGHVLAQTKTILRSAIGSLKAEEPYSEPSFRQYYKRMMHRKHATGTFRDPGQHRDCYHADDREIVRPPRPRSGRTRVWYGSIGSGDKLVKNAVAARQMRDRYQIIGVEMEAAGIMNQIPVAVIRGVCDYGDEYKNSEWQPYAAAMATAYAKTILERIPSKTKRAELVQKCMANICYNPEKEKTGLTQTPGVYTSQSHMPADGKIAVLTVFEVG